jgi:hypothetical protein
VVPKYLCEHIFLKSGVVSSIWELVAIDPGVPKHRAVPEPQQPAIQVPHAPLEAPPAHKAAGGQYFGTEIGDANSWIWNT